MYTLTPGPVREDKYSVARIRTGGTDYFGALETLRDKLKAEPELVIVFDDSFKGGAIRKLVEFAESLGSKLDALSKLAGFDPASATDFWSARSSGATRTCSLPVVVIRSWATRSLLTACSVAHSLVSARPSWFY